MNSFEIHVHPTNPSRGLIRIGDFAESFELDCRVWTGADYRRSWRSELQQLLQDSRSVAVLWTWRQPPPCVGDQRAWICWREGPRIFVQERLFVAGAHDGDFDAAGDVVVAARRESNEAADRISQWQTATAAIASFLRHDGTT